MSHHITSHHITSHHITSHHTTSHHITSHHITSHRIASYHITSHHIASPLTLAPVLGGLPTPLGCGFCAVGDHKDKWNNLRQHTVHMRHSCDFVSVGNALLVGPIAPGLKCILAHGIFRGTLVQRVPHFNNQRVGLSRHRDREQCDSSNCNGRLVSHSVPHTPFVFSTMLPRSVFRVQRICHCCIQIPTFLHCGFLGVTIASSFAATVASWLAGEHGISHTQDGFSYTRLIGTLHHGTASTFLLVRYRLCVWHSTRRQLPDNKRQHKMRMWISFSNTASTTASLGLNAEAKHEKLHIIKHSLISMMCLRKFRGSSGLL